MEAGRVKQVQQRHLDTGRVRCQKEHKVHEKMHEKSAILRPCENREALTLAQRSAVTGDDLEIQIKNTFPLLLVRSPSRSHFLRLTI
jgi:hypothetical protein